MDVDSLKAFRLGIIMAETVYGAKKVGTSEALAACLDQLKGVAAGKWSTYGSFEEIFPHTAGGSAARDETMSRVASENRHAEVRIAAAILAALQPPMGGERPDGGGIPG